MKQLRKRMAAGFITGILGFIPLLCAAQEELRPRTPGEDRFWKKADAIIRQAVPHESETGWDMAGGTEDDSGFQPVISRKHDTGPYSYDFDITYVRRQDSLSAELQFIAQKINDQPAKANELLLEMEKVRAAAVCRIRVHLNLNYSAVTFCAGKPSFPAHPGATAMVRVPAELKDGASCEATTLLLFGKFSKPRTDMNDEHSGTVHSDGQLTGGGPFTLHNISIEITAVPEAADYFIRKLDLTSLTAYIGKSLQ